MSGITSYLYTMKKIAIVLMLICGIFLIYKGYEGIKQMLTYTKNKQM